MTYENRWYFIFAIKSLHESDTAEKHQLKSGEQGIHGVSPEEEKVACGGKDLQKKESFKHGMRE